MSQAVKCLIMLAVYCSVICNRTHPACSNGYGAALSRAACLGFIPAKQVFSGLSNSTVVLFAGMFVVGAALFHTGLAQKLV